MRKRNLDRLLACAAVALGRSLIYRNDVFGSGAGSACGHADTPATPADAAFIGACTRHRSDDGGWIGAVRRTVEDNGGEDR